MASARRVLRVLREPAPPALPALRPVRTVRPAGARCQSAAPPRPPSTDDTSARIFNPRFSRSSHPAGYGSASPRARARDPSGAPGRPENIAYFTANARYYDLVVALNDAIRRNGLDFKDRLQYRGKPVPSWMSREAMSEVHDMNLADGRYEEITHKLSMLYVIRKTDPELGDLFFAPYVKPGTALVDRIAERREPTLDADGFSLARGSRKSARATVRMIPGDGVVMVNGVPAADHFGEFLSHAEEAVAPLIRTGRVGRYNAWATVRGGGLSGQAQAIKLAVARNLAIHEPALKPVLAEAGMLVADTRQVERKKTGQPGARKKFAWVKR